MARRRGTTNLSALLLVDKPAGWTSHDVVARIKSVTGEGRVGHAGTLDPMATGLLVVALGPATRMLDYLQGQAKSYRATVTFGTATSTDDAEGDVVAEGPVDVSLFSEARMREVLSDLVGTHSQVPPAYSAIKVDGKRSYAAARAGEELDLKPREITIDRVDYVGHDAEMQSVTFDITVSKGTYIRAIARDLGTKLGTPAHLSALRRTSSGNLTVDRALSVQDVVERASEGPAALSGMFANAVDSLGYPTVYARESEVASGRNLPRSEAPTTSGTNVSVVSVDGRLLAIYRTGDEPGVLNPVVVFSRPVATPNLGPCVVALGVFDGVHRGHGAIIRTAVELAAERGVPAVAVTLDPLPEAVLNAEGAPVQLTSLASRVALLEQLGAEHVVVVPFNAEVAAMSPDEYLDNILLTRVTPVAAVVGADFRYGVDASGRPTDLESRIPVHIVHEVDVDGHRARSTDVRQALSEGDLTHASRILGRPVAVVGQVIPGQAVGATLGTPTANIRGSVETRSVKHGIYAARVAVLSDASGTTSSTLDAWRTYLRDRDAGELDYRDAAVFVGRPTPNGAEGAFAFEAHILDASVDLYGQMLAVELVEFIRPPVTFPDLLTLREAIAADIAVIREVLAR